MWVCFFLIKPEFSWDFLCKNTQFMLLPHGDEANTFSVSKCRAPKGKTVPGVHREMGSLVGACGMNWGEV